MVVLSQFPEYTTSTECGFVEVEEHVDCACDCPVQAHHCRADQYYSPSGCQCLCSDQQARHACIMRGMQWDPTNCMCVCPMASWKVCSTGYIFDFTSTCQCVPMNATASTGLLAATIVLMTCLVVSVVGGYFMYKRRIGVFRPASRRASGSASNRMLNIDFEDEVGVMAGSSGGSLKVPTVRQATSTTPLTKADDLGKPV